MTTHVRTLNEARQELLVPSQQPLVRQYPFSWYHDMREQAPVYYDRDMRAWFAFRYDDVQHVLTDYATFSSNVTGGADDEERRLFELDPPRHRQLRGMINQAFTPRRIAALAPAITGIANSLLDPVLERGEMDLVDDLAHPLPVAVISDMLGLPQELTPFLRILIDAVANASEVSVEEEEKALPPFPPEMLQIFFKLIAQRRSAPQDDLLSALLAAQIDGKHLSDKEVINFCLLLFVAGHRTTTDLIANTFICLSENPEVMKQVQADLSLIPALVEELLRYYSPVQAFPRRVTRDVVLGDQQLHAGDSIIVWYGSANHDERVFAEPARFDITRSGNKHMAFGHGIHFCLGAPLARLEGAIAIQAMLERMQNIQRVPDAPLKRHLTWQFFGVEHLPITFTPTTP